MAEKREIPVYLFTGFLDAGKTTFIQETLEDPEFNVGERTLVLMCEEGEAELSPLRFASSNVKVVRLEEQEELTESYLSGLEEKHGFRQVIVEYNGMWLLDSLYSALPEHWRVYQEMTFADARTYITYNNNMRNLTADKLRLAETVVFKHFDRSMDKMDYHRIVRVMNRRCQIIYEYGSDDIEFDDIEDPLPFDLDAETVVIDDNNYAIWYTDMNEEEQKYYGKVMRIKGRTLLGGGLDEDEFVIGRHIMTCCVEDIQFGGLVAKYDKAQTLDHGGWAVMTAKVVCEFNHMYESDGPVFHVIDIQKTDPPEEEVATFY